MEVAVQKVVPGEEKDVLQPLDGRSSRKSALGSDEERLGIDGAAGLWS